MKNTVQAFAMESSLLEKLKKYSISIERSQSYIVRKALEKYLDIENETNETKQNETKEIDNEIIQNKF